MFLIKNCKWNNYRQVQKKRKKLLEGMQEENYFKQMEINTINEKLITIQQNYENNLKEVTKPQDNAKRINK